VADENHKDWRIAIEQDIRQNIAHTASLESKVEGLAIAVDRLIHVVERQATPATANYISAAALLIVVVVAIGGMWGSGYVRDLNRMEAEIISQRAWQQDHDIRVVGLNAAQWERIKANERAIYGASSPVEFGKAVGSGE